MNNSIGKTNCFLDKIVSIEPFNSDSENLMVARFSFGGSEIVESGKVHLEDKYLIIMGFAKVDANMAVLLGIRHYLNQDDVLTHPFIAIPLIKLPQDIDYHYGQNFEGIFTIYQE